jgi:hypothetical protein
VAPGRSCRLDRGGDARLGACQCWGRGCPRPTGSDSRAVGPGHSCAGRAVQSGHYGRGARPSSGGRRRHRPAHLLAPLQRWGGHAGRPHARPELCHPDAHRMGAGPSRALATAPDPVPVGSGDASVAHLLVRVSRRPLCAPLDPPAGRSRDSSSAGGRRVTRAVHDKPWADGADLVAVLGGSACTPRRIATGTSRGRCSDSRPSGSHSP